MEAVHKALKVWGGDPQTITHVVSHSTTGWDVPGLSHHVMYNLRLPESARAIPVNFVGCQGGTSVLYVATQVCRQEPDAVVLAIAAEVLSFYFFPFFLLLFSPRGAHPLVLPPLSCLLFILSCVQSN